MKPSKPTIASLIKALAEAERDLQAAEYDRDHARDDFATLSAAVSALLASQAHGWQDKPGPVRDVRVAMKGNSDVR